MASEGGSDERGEAIVFGGPGADRNTVGDSVKIFDNRGSVVVENNVIDGDLDGDGNSPKPQAVNNEVRGEQKGDFA